jgi:hypothetical protein
MQSADVEKASAFDSLPNFGCKHENKRRRLSPALQSQPLPRLPLLMLRLDLRYARSHRCAAIT